MAKQNDIQTIHDLTTAEIDRQIAALAARRVEISNERASMYAHALKNGSSGGESPIVDADERAAREHAKTLLNGSAPSPLSLPPEITREKMLSREQRGIDIALKILGDKSLVARAAEAVAWAEANTDAWCQISREITLTVIRLRALERHAEALLSGCGDLFAIRLPFAILANNRCSVSDIPLDELKAVALSEKIITHAEIRKFEHVE